MGLSVVKDFISKGWHVAIIDFNEDSGNAVAKELGDHARFIRANVVNYDEMVSAFDQTFKLWGQIDFVYANAVCVVHLYEACATRGD